MQVRGDRRAPSAGVDGGEVCIEKYVFGYYFVPTVSMRKILRENLKSYMKAAFWK